jgi:hypothetical protein
VPCSRIRRSVWCSDKLVGGVRATSTAGSNGLIAMYRECISLRILSWPFWEHGSGMLFGGPIVRFGLANRGGESSCLSRSARPANFCFLASLTVRPFNSDRSSFFPDIGSLDQYSASRN